MSRRIVRAERRADRRDRGTQAPCGEHRHHEVGPVGQRDRHHIAGRYTALTQRHAGSPHGIRELGVVQVGVVVRYRGAVGRLSGSEVGQCRKVSRQPQKTPSQDFT